MQGGAGQGPKPQGRQMFTMSLHVLTCLLHIPFTRTAIGLWGTGHSSGFWLPLKVSFGELLTQGQLSQRQALLSVAVLAEGPVSGRKASSSGKQGSSSPTGS